MYTLFNQSNSSQLSTYFYRQLFLNVNVKNTPLSFPNIYAIPVTAKHMSVLNSGLLTSAQNTDPQRFRESCSSNDATNVRFHVSSY